MTVSYESTVREMDAEELQSEYDMLRRKLDNAKSIPSALGIELNMELIAKEYYQLTGENVVK